MISLNAVKVMRLYGKRYARNGISTARVAFSDDTLCVFGSLFLFELVARFAVEYGVAQFVELCAECVGRSPILVLSGCKSRLDRKSVV